MAQLTITPKLERLRDLLTGYKRVVIAYSGGVDSAFLAKIAFETLKENAIAVTAVSPSYSVDELEETKRIAREIGIHHVIITTYEMENPNYRTNPANRCYFCKSELYSRLKPVAEKFKAEYILDGLNMDDTRDIRHGIKAAREHGIISPLNEASLTKIEIRELSKRLGMRIWDKPATPCLSSRVEYGIEISPEILRQIENAESFLREIGLKNFRVRYHRHIARIEAEPVEFEEILRQRERIVAKFKELGFIYITLDLQGFRTGSMNEILNIVKLR